MQLPFEYSFTRYLAAKRSVDDRALNRHVWNSLIQTIDNLSTGNRLQILEIGAGIGTMIERIVEWELTSIPVHYTAIDAVGENIQEAQQRLAKFPLPSNWIVEFEAVDLFDFIEREQEQRAWDLIIAHAFLDLINIPARLPQIFTLVKPSGIFYFTLNFDGITILEPVINQDFDSEVIHLYHETMDKRVINGALSGDSCAGRHLFANLRQLRVNLIDAGSSDWVVFPQQKGYTADESYFLHFIVHTIYKALEYHPAIESRRFSEWIAERHAQVNRQELVYIAHQIDFLGRKSV